jgi:hypothetical protein
MKFFSVVGTKAADRTAVDCGKFTTWIVIIKDVIGWILSKYSLTLDTFHDVNAIFVSVKQSVNITHTFSSTTCGSP